MRFNWDSCCAATGCYKIWAFTQTTDTYNRGVICRQSGMDGICQIQEEVYVLTMVRQLKGFGWIKMVVFKGTV